MLAARWKMNPYIYYQLNFTIHRQTDNCLYLQMLAVTVYNFLLLYQ
jgi:hypothetical protein